MHHISSVYLTAVDRGRVCGVSKFFARLILSRGSGYLTRYEHRFLRGTHYSVQNGELPSVREMIPFTIRLDRTEDVWPGTWARLSNSKVFTFFLSGARDVISRRVARCATFHPCVLRFKERRYRVLVSGCGAALDVLRRHDNPLGICALFPQYKGILVQALSDGVEPFRAGNMHVVDYRTPRPFPPGRMFTVCVSQSPVAGSGAVVILTNFMHMVSMPPLGEETGIDLSATDIIKWTR